MRAQAYHNDVPSATDWMKEYLHHMSGALLARLRPPGYCSWGPRSIHDGEIPMRNVSLGPRKHSWGSNREHRSGAVEGVEGQMQLNIWRPREMNDHPSPLTNMPLALLDGATSPGRHCHFGRK